MLALGVKNNSLLRSIGFLAELSVAVRLSGVEGGCLLSLKKGHKFLRGVPLALPAIGLCVYKAEVLPAADKQFKTLLNFLKLHVLKENDLQIKIPLATELGVKDALPLPDN